MNTNYILTVPHGTKVEIKYEERRDPSRSMYRYRTSADPRIRALERRAGKSTLPPWWCESAQTWVPRERRVLRNRRIEPTILHCEHYRRVGPRRKS